MSPRVLILHANGTNRDGDLAQAFELAGAKPDIVHLNELRNGDKDWDDYQILAVPGGFSYADTLGAGRLFALDLRVYFNEQIEKFISSGKLVIGICNGFQALVKSGILPDFQSQQTNATLTFNAQGHFECRWVTLLPTSQNCLWTRGLTEPIYCPVAHGEGRFILQNAAQLKQLRAHDQLALSYVNAEGQLAEQQYPYNPNGSIGGIAGVCNPQGNVLGLMPHPENHIFPYQHPRWTRGEKGNLGLRLFENAIKQLR